MSNVHKAMGSPEGGFLVAQRIHQSTESDFGSHIQWIEEQSVGVLSVALLSAALLNEEGIKRIVLVSNAWYLSQAVINFEASGSSLSPASMGLSVSSPDLRAPFPSTSAFEASSVLCIKDSVFLPIVLESSKTIELLG